MSTPTPIETEPTPLPVVMTQPKELMRMAMDVASICRAIVLKTAVKIGEKKYVRVEGWTSIATTYGCIASSRAVERVEGGWRAIGEIRRISDGTLLSQAEGFVGKDEKRWSTADEYACRGMCQTRAISRACRAAFDFVVVLMDAGLSTTPFEEIPSDGFKEDRQPCKPKQNRCGGQPDASKQPSSDDWHSQRIPKLMSMNRNAHYAGKTLGEMADDDLLYWADHYAEHADFTGKYAVQNKQMQDWLDQAKEEIMERIERGQSQPELKPTGELEPKKRELLQLLLKKIKDPKDIPMLERHLRNQEVRHFERIVLPFEQGFDTLDIEVIEYLIKNFEKWREAAVKWTASHPQ